MHIMRTRYILTILFSQLLFSLCYTQNAINKTFTIEPFNSIWIGSGFDLYLTQGSKNEISIECAQNNLDKITTIIENEKLTIRSNEAIFWKTGETPQISVTFKTLKKIIASGGSDIRSNNSLNIDSLIISSNSGSDLYLTVNCLYTKIHATGGSNINLTGHTKYIKAVVERGSDFHARNFISKICHVKINGGSNSLVNVSDELYISITGDSDIGYIGTPKLIIEKQTGGSDIYRE